MHSDPFLMGVIWICGGCLTSNAQWRPLPQMHIRFLQLGTWCHVEPNVCEWSIAPFAGDPFHADNRMGLTGTLHRISAIRDRDGSVIGLTYRIGRHVPGTPTHVFLLHQEPIIKQKLYMYNKIQSFTILRRVYTYTKCVVQMVHSMAMDMILTALVQTAGPNHCQPAQFLCNAILFALQFFLHKLHCAAAMQVWAISCGTFWQI